MNISIIGMPLFYGCDRAGVEKGPDILRENNLDKILGKNHYVTDLGNIDVDYIESKDKFLENDKLKYLKQVVDANNRLASKVYEALTNNTLPFILW